MKPHVSTETVSWMCILGALPFALMGFVKYHGMTAEKFIATWIKSEFLYPKKLHFKSKNVYYEALKDTYIRAEKEVLKNHDKKSA